MYNNSVSLPISDYRQNVIILLCKGDYEDPQQDYRTLSREKEMTDHVQMKPSSIQSEVHRLQIRTHLPQTEIAVFMAKRNYNYFAWNSDISSTADTMEKII